ncbi:hypothetical protein HJ590_11895 [Naumannella sp. ID2617S]|nr:hypothetical protein [Enemella dayhoffiae]NNG20262.1 hypothetical protein [Naumannella sp. ID2617S]
MRVLWYAFLVGCARVLIDPVREGRPRGGEWPGWLRPVLVLAAAAYALAGGLVLASGWIRANDRLITDGNLVIGAWTVTALYWLMVLTLALLATALLHVHPLIRVLGLLLIGLVLMLISVAPGPLPILVALSCFLALVGFTVARARRRPAWFEFPVVLLLLVTAVFGAMALGQRDVLGIDTRIQSLLGLITVTMLFALPTLVLAGYSLAEIPVRVAEAIGEGVRREFGPRPGSGLWVLLAVATAVTAWDIVSGITEAEWDWRWESWLSSALAVALTAALVAVLLGRRRPAAAPAVSEAYGSLGYPIAIGLISFLVVGTVGLFAGTLIGMIGLPGGTEFGQLVTGWMTSEKAVAATRCLVALAVLLLAIRRLRGGDRVTVVPAAAFVVLVGGGTLALWTGGRFALAWSVETITAWCALAALLRLAWAAARGRAGEALWPTLIVLLITVGVGRREVLAEPASLAAGVSGMAVLLLGLLWRLFTDASITRGESRAFPKVTRVLLYAANSLLAVLTLAVVAVSRADLPTLDLDNFAAMGLNLIGAPLLLGALLVALTRPLSTEGGFPDASRDSANGSGGVGGIAPDRVHTPLPPQPGT